MDYYSQDYAGNSEAVKTSTFLVTAGTLFQDHGNYSTNGKLLLGDLSYGFNFEMQAHPVNDLFLLVSSPNATPMLAVNIVGAVGLGTNVPQSTLDIQGAGGGGEVALGLRSGNSMTTLSNQIGFGYNGDIAMSHAIRTEHSTGTVGNSMDFLVWDTAAGSTSTIASLNVMSLQVMSSTDGAIHINPVGTATAELVVSSGNVYGGGAIHRFSAIQTSSRELKSDIQYLKEKDEERAYADVMSLRHARFRYKARTPDGLLVADASQPFYDGLIYEDAPESLKDPRRTIMMTDRLFNVELALKQAIRRLEKLQKRLKELEGEP